MSLFRCIFYFVYFLDEEKFEVIFLLVFGDLKLLEKFLLLRLEKEFMFDGKNDKLRFSCVSFWFENEVIGVDEIEVIVGYEVSVVYCFNDNYYGSDNEVYVGFLNFFFVLLFVE